MLQVYNLYPQYEVKSDRRKQQSAVTMDRRSGVDRRSLDRVKLDTNLTRDIFEVRNSVSAIQKAKNFQSSQMNLPFGQRFINAIQAFKNPPAVKSSETQRMINQSIKKESSSPVKASTIAAAGMMAGAVSSGMSLLFLGAAGAVIGLGSGVYIGCKAIKNAVESHLNPKRRQDNK